MYACIANVSRNTDSKMVAKQEHPIQTEIISSESDLNTFFFPVSGSARWEISWIFESQRAEAKQIFTWKSQFNISQLLFFQGPAAKEYKFLLDPFQQEALLCLDNNQSVLVSAHTSAGKTVVAEWVFVGVSQSDNKSCMY